VQLPKSNVLDSYNHLIFLLSRYLAYNNSQELFNKILLKLLINSKKKNIYVNYFHMKIVFRDSHFSIQNNGTIKI